LSLSPFKPRGPTSFDTIVVLEDLSAIRRLEHLRREFLTNVSHELKTPLAAIKGYVETLLEFPPDDPEIQRRFLERIDERVERLHSLILDMLTLARVESTAPGFDVQRLDFKRLVRSCVEGFVEAAERRGLKLINRYADEPSHVFGDAEGVATVVRNLIDNAIKYTPAGGAIEVTIEKTGEKTSVSVRDDGIGIPAKDLPRIFERFFRVDKARSNAVGGTGLGLSIVKHLVQTFDGQITVDSELGKGSLFRVSFPSAGSANADAETDGPEEDRAAKSPGGSSVENDAESVKTVDSTGFAEPRERSPQNTLGKAS
jgi:two-component system phosphate regulon sensor histidine kinase PhoR